MINEQIRDREVRLIGENGELIGIMSAKEAYKLAQEAELDLVKIAPTATPPVCKIIDYGKYKYELARKEKEAKKKQKVIEIKEVTLRFRGREMAHMASSKHILDDFAKMLEEVAVVEKPAKVEGRSMTLVLAQKR